MKTTIVIEIALTKTNKALNAFITLLSNGSLSYQMIA